MKSLKLPLLIASLLTGFAGGAAAHDTGHLSGLATKAIDPAGFIRKPCSG